MDSTNQLIPIEDDTQLLQYVAANGIITIEVIYMVDAADAYDKYRIVVEGINESRNDIPNKKKCVALYLNGNRIVSVGMNKSKTHPLLIKFGYDTCFYYSEDNRHKNFKTQYSIHAELDGYIKILNRDIEFDILMIYRGDDGRLPSVPCKICAAWIKKINKLQVIYLNRENVVECCNSYDLIGHDRNQFRRAIIDSRGNR